MLTINDVIIGFNQILSEQRITNQLLTTLVQNTRGNAINDWKSQNESLSKECFQAAEALGYEQRNLLRDIIEDARDINGEFERREFIDKYGQQMLHLNGIVQTLSQLGTP